MTLSNPFQNNNDDVVLDDGQEIKSRIQLAIKGARRTIDLAMAFFTDREIAQAIVDAHNNHGVKVRVLLSNNQMNSDVRSLLLRAGLEVYQEENVLMHAKFLIVDSKTVFEGSYNYSKKASKENKETLNISSSTSKVKNYREIFKKLISELEPMVDDEGDLAAKDRRGVILVNGSELNARLEAVVLTTLDDHDKVQTENEGRDEAEANDASPEIFHSRIEQFAQLYRNKLVRNEPVVNLIKGKIDAICQEEIDGINQNLETKLNTLEERLDVENQSIQGDINLKSQKIKEFKSNGTSKNEQKQLIQADIANYEDEIDDLRSEIPTAPLGLGAFLRFLMLGFTLVFLSVFFASTLYNLLVVPDLMKSYMEFGGDFAEPSFIYFNIIDILKSQYGWTGLGALFAFVVPFGMANIDIIMPDMHKVLKFISCYIIGIFFFDIIVALEITEIIHTSASMMDPINATAFSVKEALLNGDILIVFIFGAIPLIFSKALVSYLNKAWIHSNEKLMNKESHKKIQVLKDKISKLRLKLIPIETEQQKIEAEVVELNNEIDLLESDFKQVKDEHENLVQKAKENSRQHVEVVKGLKGKYVAMIEMGDNNILKRATEAVVQSYMHGYKSFISDRYAQRHAETKIKDIQAKYGEWKRNSFS